MQLVLVSSCLIGNPVRYDGKGQRVSSAILDRWLAEGRVLAVCPELAGGLPVPRTAAEITQGTGGAQVLQGLAKVIDAGANDVSEAFIAGARHALQLARLHGVRVAVLKEGSPSCGSGYIYDGTFTGAKMAGQGVTAALLESAGIKVFSEHQLLEADAMLSQC